jgi:hypothetical protein
MRSRLVLSLLLRALALHCGEAIAQTNSSAATAPTSASETDHPQPGPNDKKESDKGITRDAEVGLIGALGGAVIGSLIAWFAGVRAAPFVPATECSKYAKTLVIAEIRL